MGNAQPSTTTVRGECDGGLGKKREEGDGKVVFPYKNFLKF
jgi:hypothetical protein